MLIEQDVCSTCAQGVVNLETAAGVLKKLSLKYPELTFEVKSLESHTLTIIKGTAVEASIPASATIAPASGTGVAPEKAPAGGAPGKLGGEMTETPHSPPVENRVEAPTAPHPGEPAHTTSEGAGHLGYPAEAVHAPIGSGAHAAVEFGAIAVLAAQLDAVRGYEKQKAENALKALTPEIERLREAGYNVSVTLVVEIPEKVDIAAIWAGIGDAGQVVRFVKMYIHSAVMGPPPSASKSTESSHQSMNANVAPGDPDAYDPHEMTQDQQLKGQLGDKYPKPGTAPHKGFVFASSTLSLPALTASERPGGRGMTGQYLPAFVQAVTKGDRKLVNVYGMKRVMRVAKAQIGVVVTMVDLNDSATYSLAGSMVAMDQVGDADQGPGTFDRTFEKNPGKSDNYRITSHFSYMKTKDFDVMIETAIGEDLAPGWSVDNNQWRATIVWTKG
jgi:hypothetical protein